MNEDQNYMPVHGSGTKLPNIHVAQSDRDAFWLRTVDGAGDKASTKGLESAQLIGEGTVSFDTRRGP